MKTLALLAAFAVASAACSATGEELEVPEDRSAELAIAVRCDPGSAASRLNAIKLLEQMPREQLPRSDSPASGELFACLIGGPAGTHIEEWDAPADDFVAQLEIVPALDRLYGASTTDGWLFDREIIAIHALAAARTAGDLRASQEGNSAAANASLVGEVQHAIARHLSIVIQVAALSSSTCRSKAFALDQLQEFAPQMSLLETQTRQALADGLLMMELPSNCGLGDRREEVSAVVGGSS